MLAPLQGTGFLHRCTGRLKVDLFDDLRSPNDASSVSILSRLYTAAKRGDGQSAYVIGAMHEFGAGVPMDLVEARRWYRRAARLGIPAAKVRLAWLGRLGTHGVKRGPAG
jgi:TPR repeat protein